MFLIMDQKHKEILRKNRVVLVEKLEISQQFIEILMHKKILLKDHMERILVLPLTSSDKARELLGIIIRRGPTAMAHFIEALIDTHQMDIAILLDNSIYKKIISSKGIVWY
jgi:hypothetical protein